MATFNEVPILENHENVLGLTALSEKQVQWYSKKPTGYLEPFYSNTLFENLEVLVDVEEGYNLTRRTTLRQISYIHKRPPLKEDTVTFARFQGVDYLIKGEVVNSLLSQEVR